MSQTKAQLLDGSVVSVAFSAGSAAAPSLYFVGDTNTGIYSPAADTLAFVEGGVEALRIDSSGNVGIGTTSPDAKLRVFGNAKIGEGVASPSSKLVVNTISGQAAGLQLFQDGNESWVIQNPASSTALTFSNSGAERLRIDGPGRLLVGTSTSQGTATLQIQGDSASSTNWGRFFLRRGQSIATIGSSVGTRLGQIDFGNQDGAVGATIQGDTDAAWGSSDYPTALVFLTTADGAASPTERMRIDSSGRLLVGTSSARSNAFSGALATTQPVQFETATASRSSGLSIINNSNAGWEATLLIGAAGGTTIGSNTAVSNTAGLGTIQFVAGTGTNLRPAAGIAASMDGGTVSDSSVPGRLVFSTTADGAASPTERMRINSAGAVLVGNTTQFSVNSTTATGVQLTSVGELVSFTDNAVTAYFGRQTSDGSLISFRRSGAGVGTISVTTSATAYNTTSDYRLKENLEPITGAAARILQLKPSRFNFIVDPDHTVDGFIAHEAQAVVPECVTGEKDAVDDDGKPVYQGIDQSKLVPLLTAALQEAIAKIETLEARLTAAGIE